MSRVCVSVMPSTCCIRARSPSLPLSQGCRVLPAVGFVGRNGLVVVAGGRRRLRLRLRLLAAASAAVCAMVVAAGAALNDKNGSRYAKMYTRHGMELFVEGDVEGSLAEFDKALAAFPEEGPYLWQRGISLYYLNRFKDGAAQFREDIKVRPNDTEESIWCFLCEAQLYGVKEARKRMPVIGQDSRPFMRKVYELYKSGGDPPQQMLSERRSDNGQEYFYLTLYAGLYYEADKTEEAAKAALLSACQSSYGSKAKDYMVNVAKVHCKVRGWVHNADEGDNQHGGINQ